MSDVRRREWSKKETMEPLVDGSYREDVYEGYLWQCLGCGLVWTRKGQAVQCEKRGHVDHFEDGPYGVWMLLNGVPQPYPGGSLQWYTRRAVRKEQVG